MSLAGMTWKRVTVHMVVAEFLQAEAFRCNGPLPAQITSPNITDPSENHMRLRWLHQIRRWIIGEIPPDTRWFEVHDLTDNELAELHVIARCGWDAPGQDNNELLRVAVRKPHHLKPLTEWKRPILWGHVERGPFTIIDGNNRLTGYASSNLRGIAIPVLVGLSPTPCYWHIFDQCGVVAQDLWKDL